MLMTVKSLGELNADKLLEVYLDELTERREQERFYIYLLDFFSISGARYHIWDADGEYRCALRTEAYRDGYLITGLHTHPEYRSRGYAKSLLSAVCGSLRQMHDAPIYSHVDKRNTSSMRVHLACGFREILDHAVFIDGSVSWNSYTLCFR